jgi:hypothetical protein
VHRSKSRPLWSNGPSRAPTPARKRSWQDGAKGEEHATSYKLNSGITVIGIDIGNNSFQCGCLALREQRYSLSWARAA